jgi:geranylgeranyl reductase family protein
LLDRRADVLVIGAGPGGSAAAATCAAAGARVVLADRRRFPRDKVCGDGLLPDALVELRALGAIDEARATGHAVDGIRFRAPGGREGLVPCEGLVVARERLDASVRERAIGLGAEPLDAATLAGFSGVPGRWSAARFTTESGAVEVAADHFILATGAVPQPRKLAGLGPLGRCGAAVRGYARLDAWPDDALYVRFDRRFPRGYYWAFPLGVGRWNVGCGVFGGGAVALAPAAETFAEELGARWETRAKGAPLAASFPRLVVGSGNVLAVGDAAGLTRPFSGEGIGPALVSGRLAAQCLLEAAPNAARRYGRLLRARYATEYRAWRLGERLLGFPRVVDALVSRVETSRAARERIKAVLASRAPTGAILSPFGIVRILLGR